MKNLSSTSVLALALALNLLLVSCGGGSGKSSDKSSDNGGVPSVTDQEGPASAPTATAPTGPVGGASYDLAIVCNEAKEVVSITGKGLKPDPQTHTCKASGAETFSLSLKQEVSFPSPNDLTISSTDEHGNPAGGTTMVDVPINTIPPNVSIANSVPNITSSNAHSFAVEGTCLKEGQPVMVSVGGVSPTTAPNCTGGLWSVTELDVTALNGESISIIADQSSSSGESAPPQASETVTNSFICPTNFVAVPALTNYTTKSFCVMKYEAKNAGADTTSDTTDDIPVSQAAGPPYVNINWNNSLQKCEGLGATSYDLISNNEWQSMARNIENVASNWSTGVVGEGSLNRGHSDNTPSNPLEASGDDNKACEKTEQTCSSSTWDSQRRTHTLSNGEVIWDMSGNVDEWMKDQNTSIFENDSYISQITNADYPNSKSLNGDTRTLKGHFGPSGDHTGLSSSPYGGLGYGALGAFGDEGVGILRGGNYSRNVNSGVFSTRLDIQDADPRDKTGFRCVFHL